MLFICSFLTGLISAAPTRLGKNGVGEVMASTWLAGFPWERIREVRAPYVTEGAAHIKVKADASWLLALKFVNEVEKKTGSMRLFYFFCGHSHGGYGGKDV